MAAAKRAALTDLPTAAIGRSGLQSWYRLPDGRDFNFDQHTRIQKPGGDHHRGRTYIAEVFL